MDIQDMIEFDMALIIGVGLWFVISIAMLKYGFHESVKVIWKILFVVAALPVAVISAKHQANK